MIENTFDESLFDEEFYLNHHPGVAEAVRNGQFKSGFHHYVTFGYKENRISSYTYNPAHHELMQSFCSLGKNCEFGIAQRMFGADPHDLLRWANTPAKILIQLLESKFKDIGNLDLLSVFASEDNAYHVLHEGYKFTWHAWEYVGRISPDTIRIREAKRLPFLARKLSEDLSDGSRIFVVKSQDMTRDVADGVMAAIRSYGPAWLLYVTEGGPVRVEKELDGLIHATIPKFARQECVGKTIAASDWLEICTRARAMADS